MSGKQMTVESNFGSQKRCVTIEVGRHYAVKPMNKRKLKHRDRECIVLDVVPVSESHPKDQVAKVRFLDTKRQGRVDLSDLVPLGDLYEGEFI
ncbi:MAG: hypothetical protein GY869_30720 [Planctomycetes bacterium]|nr:hypothetical protein [Planctomycetota bacterium]